MTNIHPIKEPTLEEQAIEVLDFLNLKAGKRFRPCKANLKFIMARLKDATVAECRQIIAMKTREWKGTDCNKYLRPATLFNETMFEQYWGELDG